MKRNIVIGIVFIATGILLIIQRTFEIDINIWNYLWPFFLIVPGVVFHFKYFKTRNNSNNLIIGGILLTFGLLFLFNTITNSKYKDLTTFIYPLGIGIGFFEKYLFDERKNTSLIIAIVFIVISFYIFLKQFIPDVYSFRDFIIPVFLIGFGIYMLFKNMKRA